MNIYRQRRSQNPIPNIILKLKLTKLSSKGYFVYVFTALYLVINIFKFYTITKYTPGQKIEKSPGKKTHEIK